MTLTEKLNFTTDKTQAPDNAFKLGKVHPKYNNLCLYCAENDINLDDISDADFDSAAIAIENYQSSVEDYFYFWIDA